MRDNIFGCLYALKTVPIGTLQGTKQIQHTFNERDVLRLVSDMPFCCGFHESLHDRKNIYFVLEYIPGGELLHQVRKRLSLTVEHARFYLAEVILGLEAIHKQNIVYRDLKSENVLLDAEGHVKLIDFGFAKIVQDIRKERLSTQCGTPTFTAPEVLMGAKYDYKADIWSLGILICELVGGFTPFSSKSNYGSGQGPLSAKEIIELAISGNISLPKNINGVTRDLILKILVPDPNQRLTLAEIKEHFFFKGIDWTMASKRQLSPPFVPVIDADLGERSVTPTVSVEPENAAEGWSNDLFKDF